MLSRVDYDNLISKRHRLFAIEQHYERTTHLTFERTDVFKGNNRNLNSLSYPIDNNEC